MHKLIAMLIALAAVLSGCVAYEVPSRDSGTYYGSRDRDQDGVPNRYDRRPDNPRRY